jgi:type I restriction enzyme S subunit
MVSLGEVIAPAPNVRVGANPDFPILSMTMRSGLVDQEVKFRKRVASADISGYKAVRRGQLVVGFPIDEGVLDVQDLYPVAAVSPAYGIWDIGAPTRIDANYLRRYLRSPRALSYYRSKLRGSTARRRSLPASVLLALPLLLPSLAEQRRIVAILDQADALRAKQRQVLDRLDALTQAIFHDMFGDPTRHPVRAAFREIAALTSGRSVTGTESGRAGPRVLKISAVTSGVFRESESKPLPEGYSPPSAHFVHEGDLLMSRANTTELVGAVTFVESDPGNVVLPDKIWKFAWLNSDSVPEYYATLLRHPTIRRRLSALASGSGGSMKNISKAKLNDLLLPVVSTAEQQKFGERVRLVSATRRAAVHKIAEVDALIDSLQARAFRGEL